MHGQPGRGEAHLVGGGPGQVENHARSRVWVVVNPHADTLEMGRRRLDDVALERWLEARKIQDETMIAQEMYARTSRRVLDAEVDACFSTLGPHFHLGELCSREGRRRRGHQTHGDEEKNA